MRLLVIEDSEKLQYHLTSGLRKLGYEVDATGNGAEGLWYAQSKDYDTIILDLMLPEMDGLSVLAGLRRRGKSTGVLILTARDKVADRVHGLRAGADDYLVKPFAFDELVARVEALTRRRYGTRNSQLIVRGLVIDTAARTALRNGQAIELTSREYLLLEFLALRRDRVFSRAEIEAHICRDDADVSSNVVDAAVYSLRRKIDVEGQPSIIMTRRGMGYVIVTGESECRSEGE